MSTIKFKRFTKPHFLKQIGRELLDQFFNRFNVELGERQIVLPATTLDDDTYFVAMSQVAMSPDGLPTKVALASRLVGEISAITKVTGFVGDLLDEVVLDELVRCDLILGCTDSNYARAALGDIASHYLVPVLDFAVQMRAENGILREQIGEIGRYGPELPCPWCRGRICVEGIRYETATEGERKFGAEAAAAAEQRGIDGAQYWGGTPPPELTVGYLTTVVGAMGVGYAQNLLLGSGKLPHNRFQFDLGFSSLGVVADERPARDDCACQRAIGWSDQARADRSVSQPSHWPRAIKVSNG
jgi:hypothetical protein